jgi:hypothetical protein
MNWYASLTVELVIGLVLEIDESFEEKSTELERSQRIGGTGVNGAIS